MKKTMLILIILASLIPGILAVIQYIENNKKEIQMNSKIDSLKIGNSELKKKLILLSNDNIKLSHQLTETALKLNDNVIGNGDLDVEIQTTKPNEFSFRFVNKSSFPVRNTNIVIQNYSEIIKCEVVRETENQIHIKSECYKDKHTRLSGIDFNPHGAYLDSNNIYPFTNGYMNFAIRISTLKKTVFYHIVYKIINGTLQSSKREFNLINEKMIFVNDTNNLNLPKDYWSKNFYTKILYID